MQADAADGFVFAPHLTPGRFDEFVERVVPILQERGLYRTDYMEGTLRVNLGLPDRAAQYSTPHLASAAV
ncbi:hypothetical protein JOH50_006331 [Rhizobium leguminosarum]|uniref:hypothetical protein n=1 Tax=Rhizobium leguminosarum TaxID=384 RepID=UPI001ED36B08|nr:hypothetical protein [Rhizobium leguminosarum]MBP2490535.1 hypothetical protein [Rhizobium leguminosarum]